MKNRVLSLMGVVSALAFCSTGQASAASISFNVTLKNTLNSKTTTQIYWDGVTLPNGFTRSNVYMEVTSNITEAGSGLQIYTDNMASDANPAFKGNPAYTNPAGLVDSQRPTFTLPMAWSVKIATYTISDINPNSPPTATDPNGCANGVAHSCQWVYFTDKSTVLGPPGITKAYQDGAEFQTVIASDLFPGQCSAEGFAGGVCAGAQFDQFTFFASPATVYIYTEANFSTAGEPDVYQTTTLRLEAFTQ
jgi:hypothetical protein